MVTCRCILHNYTGRATLWYYNTSIYLLLLPTVQYIPDLSKSIMLIIFSFLISHQAGQSCNCTQVWATGRFGSVWRKLPLKPLHMLKIPSYPLYRLDHSGPLPFTLFLPPPTPFHLSLTGLTPTSSKVALRQLFSEAHFYNGIDGKTNLCLVKISDTRSSDVGLRTLTGGLVFLPEMYDFE